MAPVMLPPPTRETEIEVRELSFAKDMMPTTGGPSQRQDRMGTRHAIRFSIPVKRYAWCGAGLAADLAVGRTGEGAAIIIPEPGVDQEGFGTPLINGSGQLGLSVSIKGLTVGAVIKKGKWLSIQINDRHYAYFTTQDVTVPAGGIASVPIHPRIRRSAAGDSVVRLKNPLIQGLIKDPVRRKILRALVGAIGLDFEIEEQE